MKRRAGGASLRLSSTAYVRAQNGSLPIAHPPGTGRADTVGGPAPRTCEIVPARADRPPFSSRRRRSLSVSRRSDDALVVGGGVDVDEASLVVDGHVDQLIRVRVDDRLRAFVERRAAELVERRPIEQHGMPVAIADGRTDDRRSRLPPCLEHGAESWPRRTIGTSTSVISIASRSGA